MSELCKMHPRFSFSGVHDVFTENDVSESPVGT